MKKQRKQDRGRGGRGGDVEVSKAMSKVLRHNAIKEGVNITPSGWVELNELMQYLRRQGLQNITEERIRGIVENNDKKRFEFEEQKNRLFIRATQGHSIKEINTEDLLTKIEDPQEFPLVIHGTFSKFWPLIKKQGLKRMTRNHIHFAPGMPRQQGVISGMRGNCDVIIQIDMFAAIKEGIPFYISSNNVILTEGDNGVLPIKFFKKVMKKDGSLLLEAQENEKNEQKQKVEQAREYSQKQERRGNKIEKKQQIQEKPAIQRQEKTEKVEE